MYGREKQENCPILPDERSDTGTREGDGLNPCWCGYHGSGNHNF